MDVLPPKRRFHISLSKVMLGIQGIEHNGDSQFFARSGDHILGMRNMRIPLHIGDIPSSTLRKEARNSVERFKVEYKEAPPTRTQS